MSRLRIEIDLDDVTLIRNICRIYHTSLPTGLPQSCSPWRFSGVIFSTSAFSVGFGLNASSQMCPFSTRISSSSPSRRLHCSSIVFGMRTGLTVSPLNKLCLRDCHITLPPKLGYIHSYIPVKEVCRPLHTGLSAYLITVSSQRRLSHRSPARRFYRWSELTPLFFFCSPSPPSLFFRPKPRAPSPSA